MLNVPVSYLNICDIYKTLVRISNVAYLPFIIVANVMTRFMQSKSATFLQFVSENIIFFADVFW